MRRPSIIVLGWLFLCSACGGSDTPRTTNATAPAEAAPALDELRQATYAGFADDIGEVTLADGHWEGAPFVDGGAARPSVDLVGDLSIVGDVDGDGTDEAIALLAQRGGGTGEYLHVAVVDRTGERLLNTATALIGDRVQVRRASVDSGTVVLDVVQAGPDDAMCCPGDLVTRSWVVDSEGMSELEPVVTGRLRPETLTGSEWVLAGWNLDEPAPEAPVVTLVYDDGNVGGSSGCNRYFGAITPGEAPGDIRIGPVGGTMMACPDDVMAVETRYQTLLGAVEKMGFHIGRLALTYVHDDTGGMLLFEPRAASETGAAD
jgi:heat shock protein HslJ